MTTPLQQSETPAPPTPPSAPVGSIPAGTSPPPSPAWTAPASAPEWARGKSPEEILAIGQKAIEALSVQPPPPAPRAPAPPNGMPTDDTWISRPNDAATSIADARIAKALEPALAGWQGIAATQATQSRYMAAQQMADVFGKYGHEVDAIMKDQPLEARTLDNYVKVAKYVRGEHIDEFAADRAKAMIAAGGGLGERSGGNGLPGAANAAIYDADKLPAGMGEVAKRHGMTESMVLDFCKKQGWTVEKWMNEFTSGKVFTSTSPFTSEMRDDQLGIKKVWGE